MYRMKTLAIAFMAIGLTALVGCKKDEIPDDSGNQGTDPPSSSMVDKTFTVSIDNVAIMADGGPGITMTTADQIGIYDGYGRSLFNITAVDDKGVATITGKVDNRAEAYYAVWPSSAAQVTGTDHLMRILVTGSQTISTGTSASSASLVCTGKEADGNFSLSSMVSFLKLDLEEGTTSVTLRGKASGPVSGDVYVSADGTVTSVDASTVWTDTEQTVTIRPQAETFTAGTYYMCILPVTFGSGFDLIYQKGEAVTGKTTTDAVEFKANAVVDASKLSTSTAQTGTEFDPFIISTVDELMGLSSEKYAAGTYVKLAADIDMSDQAWTPISIACHFDGDNHKIYNIKVSGTGAASIFNVTSGASLKNIVFGSSDGKMYDGESSITVTEGNGKIGLVENNNGTLENVTTYIPVTVTLGGTPTSEVRVAGLVASNYSNITSCANYGDINVSGTYGTSDKDCFVGGITGWASQAECAIKDTDNHGDITVNTANLCGVGGIVGMNRGENIDGCENTGALIIQNTLPGEGWVGGIVGFAQQQSGSEKKVSGCRNSGAFNVTTPSVVGVGGIFGCINYTKVDTDVITIENCTNESDIAVATANSSIHIGGILAREAISGATATVQNKITGCINNGDVSLGAPVGAENSGLAYIGGIAGKVEKMPVIENNTNNGAVSSTKLTACHAGGILGHASGSALTLKGNTNSGSVNLSPDKSDATQCYAGGILGTSASGNAEISTNTNSAAEVSIVCNSASASYKPLSYVGGIVGGTTDDAVCTTYKNKNSAAVLSETQAIWVPTGGIMGLAKGSVSLSEDVNLGDVTLISTNTGLGDMFAGGIVGLACAPAAESTGEVKTSLSKVMSFCDIDSDGLCGLAIGCIAYNYDAPVSILDSVFGGTYVFKGGEPANAADAKIEIGGGLLGYKNPEFSKYTQSGNEAGNAEDYGY